MRRLLIIAVREYMSYARTVGFWLSLAIMPLALAAGAMLPDMLDRAAPIRNLAIVDVTGQDLDARVRARLETQAAERRARALEIGAVTAAGRPAGDAVARAFDEGGEAAAQAEFRRLVPSAGRGPRTAEEPFRLVELPSELPGATRDEANAALRPFIAGDRTLPDGRTLDAAAVLHNEGGRVSIDLWNANLSDAAIEGAVRAAVREELRRERLASAGLSPALLREVENLTPEVRVLSPKARQGAEVSLRDRLPAIVGFVLGLVLWSAVLTGAGILLNSVMEEKSNRVLEILAASATTTQLMGGKILGVALLALTLLSAWSIIGVGVLVTRGPGLAEDLRAVLLGEGFLVYFALYAVLGYVMYAAAFAAIGAFCESQRDAQALLGPIMLLLTVPVLFMGLALREPDAPALQVLSWIPPFTPFIMLARAAGDPPWWEIAGTLALMAVTTVAVVAISGRAFHAGALSTGRPNPKAWLARLFGGKRKDAPAA